MKSTRDSWSLFLRIIPPVITVGLIVFFVLYLRDFTFHDLLRYTPSNLFAAAGVLILIYSVKSMSIVFPLAVLYVSSGVLFPLWAAILVNLLGLTACVSIPFGVGCFSGQPLMQKLTQRYKKIEQLSQIGTSNEVFSAYILRAVGILPGDVASMVMGAMGYRYGAYLLGSLLGLIPAMLIQTMMGQHIDQPLSPLFIGLFVLLIAVSLVSTFLYNRSLKKKKQL